MSTECEFAYLRDMYRVFGLRLGPNFAVRLAAEKNFYLRLTVGKMHAFDNACNRYLRPHGCSNTHFTATVNCPNPKTEVLSEIIEIQTIGM